MHQRFARKPVCFRDSHRSLCVSEIRTEAVMQALAMQKKQSVIPMPSKRTSAVYSPRRKDNATGACGDRCLTGARVHLRVSLPTIYCPYSWRKCVEAMWLTWQWGCDFWKLLCRYLEEAWLWWRIKHVLVLHYTYRAIISCMWTTYCVSCMLGNWSPNFVWRICVT